MEDDGKKNRILRRGDILLLAGILLFSGIFWLAVHFLMPEGKKVSVSVDGKVLYTLSISGDEERTVETDLGKNVIRIADGEVSVIDADCPDKLCVRHSAIHKSGETIVCLPHKLIVEVTGE